MNLMSNQYDPNTYIKPPSSHEHTDNQCTICHKTYISFRSLSETAAADQTDLPENPPRQLSL